MGALELYTSALSLEPASHTLLSNRSLAHARLNEFVPALADAEACIDLSPSWHKAFMRKGAALMGLNRHTEAEAAFAEAVRLSPEEAAAKDAWADARQKAAMADLNTRVLEFARHKQTGAALVKAGEYDEAVREYAAALETMQVLLDRLPSTDASPIREKVRQCKIEMERELENATSRKADRDAQSIPLNGMSDVSS
uniref:Uncharacterized protein n=1 Tax=Coccolithus braarudii TaxID=221442 RepID=A0A7S0L528_9EUKA